MIIPIILFYCYVYKLSYSFITKSIELTERQRGHMIEFVQSSVVSYYSVILNYNYLTKIKYNATLSLVERTKFLS